MLVIKISLQIIRDMRISKYITMTESSSLIAHLDNIDLNLLTTITNRRLIDEDLNYALLINDDLDYVCISNGKTKDIQKEFNIKLATTKHLGIALRKHIDRQGIL